jgi:Putative phage serine protease XkdF
MLLTIDIDEDTGKVVIDPGTARKQAAEPEPWDGESIAAQVVKSAPERRFTLAVAYPSMRVDVGVAADGARDFANPEAVEQAAWSYLSKGGGIGIGHQQGTDRAGQCVESYIFRGDAPWVIKAADGSTQTVHPGDWLLGVVWTPEAWRLIKSGELTGVSMQGTASRRKPTPEALAALRKTEAEGGAAE